MHLSLPVMQEAVPQYDGGFSQVVNMVHDHGPVAGHGETLFAYILEGHAFRTSQIMLYKQVFVDEPLDLCKDFTL